MNREEVNIEVFLSVFGKFVDWTDDSDCPFVYITSIPKSFDFKYTNIVYDVIIRRKSDNKMFKLEYTDVSFGLGIISMPSTIATEVIPEVKSKIKYA